MNQIKEAIELLGEAKTHLQHKFNDEMTKECIDQAIAKLRTEPKCKTCGDSGIKKPEEGCGKCLSIDGNCRADCPCPACQSPEQPPAREFREIVSNRFPVFLPDSYEGMKSLCAELTDTINEACAIIDHSEAGERILEERIEKLSDTLDRSEARLKEYGGQRCTAVCSRCKRISHWCLLPQGHVGEHIHYCQFKFLEASRKDLLTACVEFCQEFSDYGRICNPKTTDWRHSQKYKEQIIDKFEVAIAKAKEVKI